MCFLVLKGLQSATRAKERMEGRHGALMDWRDIKSFGQGLCVNIAEGVQCLSLVSSSLEYNASVDRFST